MPAGGGTGRGPAEDLLRRGRPAAAAPARDGGDGLLARVPPIALVLAGGVSVQIGAGLAARLFTQLPAAAVTGLRLWAAALIIAVVGARGLARTVRALVRNRSWRDTAIAVAFGLTLAVMNFSIYQAMARIPLGIAVTIEFLGPLAVAVVSSRRALDLLWVALAAAGVLLLSRGGTSLAHSARPGDTGLVITGTLFALTAAACWALYIVLSRSTGRRFSGSSGLVLAMIIAAVAVTPPAIAAGHAALLRPEFLAMGALIGLLSSVIPYAFEMQALRRIPPRVFGILMSLEPAIAALVGLVLLSESLMAREWVAIVCVTVASAGAARATPREVPPPQA
ncbi:MAG TPA: EamA family transporter [Streptosporangiaceae bacterium]|nr:EamA family transporter [Streptosporangiaceae bacterium]